MTGRILYKASVGRDLKKITPRDVERILRQIRSILGDNPRTGEALHGEFEGLFKLRVGDYRAIYTLSGGDVLVLMIRHRAKVYG